MAKKALVLGAGFGGLASAAYLARDGFEVEVIERHDGPGGRARVWEEQGFTFDMGPSWYLMPEVFEHFFMQFGRKREDYYSLVPLNPYYRVHFSDKEIVAIGSDKVETARIFEQFEPGGGGRLQKYLEASRTKYEVAMAEFMRVEYRSIFQFFNWKMITQGLRMDLFSSLDTFVRKFFTDRRARQILEYAMVFLGSSPSNAPALYSIMSHVDMNMGVLYPMGGFGVVVRGMEKLCRELGVSFRYGTEVRGFEYKGRRILGAKTDGGLCTADVVVASADYHHVETELLDKGHRSIPSRVWNRKVMAPSMFIMYLGLDKKLEGFDHHTLFLSEHWDEHFSSIFDVPSWPVYPCFYLSCPSRTDPTVAPAGKENLFVLVPISPGLEDTESIREEHGNKILEHIERICRVDIRNHIVVRRIYSVSDFTRDYHAFKGSALGLAHVLRQTAIFRPSLGSRKVPNLVYGGQYTHPGVGVPMVLIAGELAARAAAKRSG